MTVTKCPTVGESGKLAKVKAVKAKAEAIMAPRAEVPLPPVKVAVLEAVILPSEREAFFRDAARVEHTQAAISEKAVNVAHDHYYFTGRFRDGKGLDPRDVIRKHRDIIGSTPEGLAALTRYERFRIGPYACLEIARRSLATEHRGGPGVDVVRHWNAYPPKGTPEREYLEWLAKQRAIPDTGKPFVTYDRKGDRSHEWSGGRCSSDSADE